jgi:hypothetical protein
MHKTDWPEQHFEYLHNGGLAPPKLRSKQFVIDSAPQHWQTPDVGEALDKLSAARTEQAFEETTKLGLQIREGSGAG